MADRKPLPIKPRSGARPPSPRETTERKIYVLPTEQVERIKAYQAASGISSEVEAVRRLLDTALEMRDTALDLLNKVKSRLAHEKDLRVLAKDILAGHSRLKAFSLVDDAVEFVLTGDEHGRIDNKGKIYLGEARGYEIDWSEVRPSDPPTGTHGGGKPRGGGGWDTPKTDLDDDIPF